MDIIQYLLSFIQYQHQQICWLLNFICRYIPLKQWAFDDSHSPKYQKFKVDELPVIKTFVKQHTSCHGVLWSSIFVTLMANKIGGLQFGIYRNCQISSRVFHTAVAALPLTKANRSDFE